MKPLYAILVFAAILTSSILAGTHGFRTAQDRVRADLDQALQRTLAAKDEAWITPDTIRTYRSHLMLPQLKDKASVAYCLSDDSREGLGSRRIVWEHEGQRITFRAYANCSMATVLAISDQRVSLLLLLAAMSWGFFALFRYKRSPFESSGDLQRIGGLSYCATKGLFYDCHREPIHLTPMQEQLMRMFMATETHTLSQQEICDALWPKKENASETLHTLIRRLKMAVEERCQLRVIVDRGRSYSLKGCH